MVSLLFACRIMNCTNAKKTRQVDGIYRTAFILSESHILATKKSPTFLQGSIGTNRVSAQFILMAKTTRRYSQVIPETGYSLTERLVSAILLTKYFRYGAMQDACDLIAAVWLVFSRPCTGAMSAHCEMQLPSTTRVLV